MKFLKPIIFTVIFTFLLGSCKSISTIPVPKPSSYSVTAIAKKAPLTEEESKFWGHSDLVTDSIPGMSLDKAYDFLQGKKGIEVVVGVVDSGTDLLHEDLKNVAWINSKEIPSNGIDDDKNGYVDDINGWNFLGTIYKEHLEYQRIVKDPSIANEESVKEAIQEELKEILLEAVKTPRVTTIASPPQQPVVEQQILQQPVMSAEEKRAAYSNILGDMSGQFTAEVSDFAGMHVKDADKHIIKMLKDTKALYRQDVIVHSYPFCPRSDTPIIYRTVDSWYVKVESMRSALQKSNQEINWVPGHIQGGRMGKWLEGAVDWAISRNRYWGTPLPIWINDVTGARLCMGSIDELESYTGVRIDDLHRENVDELHFSLDGEEGVYRRIEEVLDCWFESGSMPYAQLHYPFENETMFEQGFPAEFIAEGLDQTRGWFYTLHTIATTVFKSIAYKNVISNGLVLDKNGQKMSKRLGNAVDPFKTISKFGPDATRWYMISNANPWDNLKFDLDGIEESKRKFFGTLYNVYSFFALYANIDNFKYSESEINISDRPELDKWILSELNSLIAEVDDHYDNYEPTKAARAISNFVQLYLSNWYVRLSRRRFWKGSYSHDKISAYQTLYKCLTVVSKLSSPIAPFFMDRLYKDLVNNTSENPLDSVHHDEFPVSKSEEIYPDLQKKISGDGTTILVDFRLPSSHKRLWVVRNNKVLVHCRVAHGKNSGELITERFSNQPETNMSCIGEFKTGRIYDGEKGLAMRLHGLEVGVNDNAYERGIVFHGGTYVSYSFLMQHGRIGRSHGCFVTEPRINARIIRLCRYGATLFVSGHQPVKF